MVGVRGRRDMESINFIADDLYLIKFRGSIYSGIKDYWTIIDKYGQIKKIPKACLQQLCWSSFSAGNARNIDSGALLVLKGG